MGAISPVTMYYFITYNFKQGNSFGAGTDTVYVESTWFPIGQVTGYVLNKNKFTQVALSSWVEISKAQYDEYSEWHKSQKAKDEGAEKD